MVPSLPTPSRRRRRKQVPGGRVKRHGDVCREAGVRSGDVEVYSSNPVVGTTGPRGLRSVAAAAAKSAAAQAASVDPATPPIHSAPPIGQKASPAMVDKSKPSAMSASKTPEGTARSAPMMPHKMVMTDRLRSARGPSPAPAGSPIAEVQPAARGADSAEARHGLRSPSGRQEEKERRLRRCGHSSHSRSRRSHSPDVDDGHSRRRRKRRWGDRSRNCSRSRSPRRRTSRPLCWLF